jgi:hypothetical protein
MPKPTTDELNSAFHEVQKALDLVRIAQVLVGQSIYAIEDDKRSPAHQAGTERLQMWQDSVRVYNEASRRYMKMLDQQIKPN